jgi:CheY-like chemotaxis protein
MPAAGRLTIETANVTLTYDRAANEPPAESLAAGEYVTLSVTDTGSGMPPEVLKQAFEPFFTTKPIGKGTGLGLSTIHGFAKQSGGHAHICSEVGHGTRVTIYLPRHFGPANVRGPLHVAARGSYAGHSVVLVVEDELPLRGALIEMLRDRGLTVLEADTGRGGLTVLETQAGVSLLVTDVGLPGGMNGRELANAARRLFPELKVLFITGYAEGGVIADGTLEAGMQLMTKPFTLNKFANKVQDMIAA